FGTAVAKPAGALPKALGTDVRRYPLTRIARDHRRIITGQNRDPLSRAPGPLARHTVRQRGGRAEIVLVLKRHARRQQFPQRDGGRLVLAPARRLAVGAERPLAKAEGAQVTAAFEPEVSEHPVEIVEGRDGSRFDLEPVRRWIRRRDHKLKYPAR